MALALDSRLINAEMPAGLRARVQTALTEAFNSFASDCVDFGIDPPPLKLAQSSSASAPLRFGFPPSQPSQPQDIDMSQLAGNTRIVLQHVIEPAKGQEAIPKNEELATFMHMKPNRTGDALQFWRENQHFLPWLTAMARNAASRVYLALPASSAPCERTFSAGKLTVSDHRHSLSFSQIEKLVYVKMNTKLLKLHGEDELSREKTIGGSADADDFSQLEGLINSNTEEEQSSDDEAEQSVADETAYDID